MAKFLGSTTREIDGETWRLVLDFNAQSKLREKELNEKTTKRLKAMEANEEMAKKALIKQVTKHIHPPTNRMRENLRNHARCARQPWR